MVVEDEESALHLVPNQECPSRSNLNFTVCCQWLANHVQIFVGLGKFHLVILRLKSVGIG